MELTSQRLSKNLVNSFLWMLVGLLLTSATAAGLLYSGLIISILSMPSLSIILLVVQFGLILGMSAMMKSASVNTIRVMFFVYSITMGISLSPIALIYTGSSIALAFGVCAFYFLCLTLIGLTTKVDLSKIGLLCTVGLFVLIIFSIFSALFSLPTNTYWLSVAGLLIFTGLTAWDVQRAKRMFELSESDTLMTEKLSVYFALELYLDFLNLFLYILQLLGKKK